MGLKIGIVGLPNVGKSTLFNALTRTKGADAQNYPFCTIDPNVGIVEVPDTRLIQLSEVSRSEKVIPASIEFVDIAGLVKGASEGEGLGNKFLSHIRECDAIGHVIRIFEDGNITHVHGDIDPQMDREVIESELLLSDLQTVEKRLQKAQADAKSGDKEKKAYAELLQKVYQQMQTGMLAIDIDLTPEERAQLQDLHLLTMKPNIYIINVAEDEVHRMKEKAEFAKALGVDDLDKVIPVCAKLEEELADLDPQEAMDYLQSMEIVDTGLNHLIQSAYKTLGLMTYFTAGPKEARAWTIKEGDFAPDAAGVIHTDFKKGFIKAEVVHWSDFVEHGGEQGAKEKGRVRMEGKDYLVKDGDVMHFKFSS